MNERKRMNLYWKYVAEQNADELLKFFHKNGVIRWLCTNEQFTVPEFIKANCDYPGKWNGAMERGKIIQLDEYWGDDCEIPEWRRNMKLGMPIL